MSKPFIFKQFVLKQDRCAMKVGTDGVLLGAWTPLDKNPDTILDIGSGTGLIALMLAQRSTAETIDGIEIQAEAHEQCVDNFESSPWADRLFCYHAGLDEFVDEMDEKYDLIVSNPPFYAERVSSGNRARDTARQNESLSFDTLLRRVSKLLSKDGVFSVIVPFKEEEHFLRLAKKVHLYPKQRTRVKGNPESDIKRSLLAFVVGKTDILSNEIIIEKGRHEYTPEYIALTQAFYLKM